MKNEVLGKMLHQKRLINIIFIFFILSMNVIVVEAAVPTMELRYQCDPFTRLIHITYQVPDSIPQTVTVRVEVQDRKEGKWLPARILLNLPAARAGLLGQIEYVGPATPGSPVAILHGIVIDGGHLASPFTASTAPYAMPNRRGCARPW